MLDSVIYVSSSIGRNFIQKRKYFVSQSTEETKQQHNNHEKCAQIFIKNYYKIFLYC